ncbi:MAG: DUF1802 family protein [Methanobrevibacter sp.]
MNSTSSCLNEWNAIVEAFGQRKEVILIRRYKTKKDGFLLYPTVNYAHQKNFIEVFKDNEKDFVYENLYPKKLDEKSEVKYYAKVDSIIQKPTDTIEKYEKYHIWTSEHIKDYVHNETSYIWLLRVYELQEPLMLKRGGGRIYSKAEKEVSLENMAPIFSDIEFNKIKEDILNI